MSPRAQTTVILELRIIRSDHNHFTIITHLTCAKSEAHTRNTQKHPRMPTMSQRSTRGSRDGRIRNNGVTKKVGIGQGVPPHQRNPWNAESRGAPHH